MMNPVDPSKASRPEHGHDRTMEKSKIWWKPAPIVCQLARLYPLQIQREDISEGNDGNGNSRLFIWWWSPQYTSRGYEQRETSVLTNRVKHWEHLHHDKYTFEFSFLPWIALADSKSAIETVASEALEDPLDVLAGLAEQAAKENRGGPFPMKGMKLVLSGCSNQGD